MYNRNNELRKKYNAILKKLKKKGIKLKPSESRKLKKELAKKAKKILSAKRRKFAIEVSKLASKANKRLVRLENKGLKKSIIYQKFLKNNKSKFSVKNKTYRELQTEKMKILNFLNSETSTIRGMNKVLKKMAKNTNIKYSKVGDLHKKAIVFFKLAKLVEEYLRLVEGSASALGYKKIWDAVNEHVNNSKKAISDSKKSIESALKEIVKSDILQAEYKKWDRFFE